MYIESVYFTAIGSLSSASDEVVRFVVTTDFSLSSATNLGYTGITQSYAVNSVTKQTISYVQNLDNGDIALWSEYEIVDYVISGTKTDLTFTWPCIIYPITSISYSIEQNELAEISSK